MRKRISILLAFVFLCIGASRILAASLDLNTEYRFRGISYRNPDFNVEVRDNSSYYENRLRFTVDGSPYENIRILTKIQSLGLAGGSTAYTLVGGTTTARYPETGSQPWIENAYIQIDNVGNIPLTLTLGRQPFFYGAGLIMADDELGFNAIRGSWHLSNRFTVDAYTAKISEARFGETDFDAYGITVESKKSQSEWLLAFFGERDRTGEKIRDIPTALITKYFLEYYLKKDLSGAYYSVDIALQRGNIKYSEPTSVNQKYRGSRKFKADKLFDYLKPLGYALEGGLRSHGNTFTGPMEVHAALAVGTGDDAGTIVENESFSPSLGHCYDGLERVGYGEFYAATLSDVNYGLPPGYAGLRIMKFGGTMSPFAAIKIGLDYFLFDAEKAASGGAKEMGRELDFTLRYSYSSYIAIDASYALFFPKDGTRIDGSKAERLTLGITGRF